MVPRLGGFTERGSAMIRRPLAKSLPTLIIAILAVILSSCGGSSDASSSSEPDTPTTSISVTLNNVCDYIDGCVLKSEAQNVNIKLKSGPSISLFVHIYCIETGDGKSYNYNSWRVHITAKQVDDAQHANLLDTGEYAYCSADSGTPDAWLNVGLVAGTYSLEAEDQALPVTITVVPEKTSKLVATTTTTVP